MLLSKVAEEKEGKWVTLELRVCWPSWEGKATQGAMAGWILAHGSLAILLFCPVTVMQVWIVFSLFLCEKLKVLNRK